jgi:Ca2+-binding EF-hand superfamily protein
MNLFNYLDHDGDGKISPANLSKGLSELQSYSVDDLDPDKSISCEFEVEEILRSLPE